MSKYGVTIEHMTNGHNLFIGNSQGMRGWWSLKGCINVRIKGGEAATNQKKGLLHKCTEQKMIVKKKKRKGKNVKYKMTIRLMFITK